MENIAYFSGESIEKATDFKSLIAALKAGFCNQDLQIPMRHHHDFPNPEEGTDSTLLLMPAFNPGRDLGVKIVTVSPNNGKFDMPAIQGIYLYLDAHKGNIKAMLDAKALTAKRTAATSALASSFLSRPDSSSLLMLGTGALSSNLILAHAAVRPIKKVYVWGRNISKAQAIVDQLAGHDFEISAVADYRQVIGQVDIISTATLSATALVFGADLQPGQHLDLVGAYKKDTREADDQAVIRSRVFIDTYQGGLKEGGDIVIPMANGTLKREDIQADLFELCLGQKIGRETQTEITFFKSVGHALEDLVAAGYYCAKF
jgi:ornithine cyclodeaminase/alanine dehydrogenase-like protein (mu-crystallin family)